jgi:enediyne biosynthesis protein E4
VSRTLALLVSAGAAFVAPALPAGSSAPDAPIRFEERAGLAGIRTVNMFGGVDSKRYILETTGTGAALFDYDGDGDLDLFLVNGTRFDYGELQSPSNALYRNDGTGNFVNVTREAGLEAWGWGQGASVADFDDDGDHDLLVTYYGPNRFYRNDGDGTFTEIGKDVGLDDPAWGTSAAFADFDGDGIDDLFVANYVDFDRGRTPGPGEAPNCFFMGIPVMCGPKGLPPASSLLYRGGADGRFQNVTGKIGIGTERAYGLGAVWGDLDNDGDPDLYVANDQTPNNLFRNDGGRFTDIALEAGVAYNEDGRAQAGMGVDFGDYNNDGWLDIHVTNFSHDYNTLYRNTGQGYFVDESFAAGIGRETFLYLGWGTGFEDFDRDGYVDLFVANGHVYPEVDTYDNDSDYAQPSFVFQNRGDGTFEAPLRLTGASGPRVGRGAAFGDVDDDGDVDVLVTNMNAEPSLFLNETESGAHWVGLELVGTRSGRDALGARVTIEAGGLRQMREVRSGGSYLSASDPRLLFGLGAVAKLDRVEVRWPSGAVEILTDVPFDRYSTWIEPRSPSPSAR